MTPFYRTGQSLSPVRGTGACDEEVLLLRITNTLKPNSLTSLLSFRGVLSGGALAPFCLKSSGLWVFSEPTLGGTSLTGDGEL